MECDKKECNGKFNIELESTVYQKFFEQILINCLLIPKSNKQLYLFNHHQQCDSQMCLIWFNNEYVLCRWRGDFEEKIVSVKVLEIYFELVLIRKK